MLLILQKSVKSLQLILNEFTLSLGFDGLTITNSAYTQARANLRHTAFIELNQKAVVEVMYQDDNIKRYKGMRVLGIDGSKVILPNTEDIKKEFGQISYANHCPQVKGKHAYGMASVMYDVLNRVAIDSTLSIAKAYEVELAVGHIAYTQENDLLIYDRNYPSYFHISHLSECHKKFVMRCSRASFKQAREMLQGKGKASQIVSLKPHHAKLKQIREYDLPEETQVRFVRVELSTGEYEVLVTNLLDEQEFPTEEFLEIYAMRWGIEGFYGILKTRLNLENFTGKTAESVYQDFYSTIYLSGIESLLTADIDEKLAQKPTKNKQKVNRAVSFNAIKNQAMDLLFSEKNREEVITQLEQLFLMNPVSIRSTRKVPRQKRSARHLLNHANRQRKICF